MCCPARPFTSDDSQGRTIQYLSCAYLSLFMSVVVVLLACLWAPLKMPSASSVCLPGSKSPANPELTGKKEKPQKQPLFHDDTLPSFFRRLAWSPDGEIQLQRQLLAVRLSGAACLALRIAALPCQSCPLYLCVHVLEALSFLHCA